jgi:hypothetical protein
MSSPDFPDPVSAIPESSTSPIPLGPPDHTPPTATRFPLLRWICTNNPFYVISAALFLAGLRISFGEHARDSWALIGGLSFYTLLLAGAALLLVRFARVWNDVRTVLLLVVLMFLATSVTFDELLVLNPARGRWYFLGGLGFAVALTEALLRGIRLRLPLLFRVPYHLTLVVFFLYPLALVPVIGEPHSEVLMWGLWGFAPVAGLALLTLLPAIRRGHDYLRDNGSPWPWPYYPWSVFVFLAVAVCGRAFLLCWSFHLLPSANEQLIFGPYFLVPLGLVVAVLLLELGLVSRSRVTQWIALAVPAGLVVLAAVGHRNEAIYAEFLGHFATRLGGTPLFVTLVAISGFYLYAWTRRVTFAVDALTIALAALAFVKPDALTFFDLTATRAAFVVVALLLQVWVWLWRRVWWRLAVSGTVAIGWLGMLAWRIYCDLREEIIGLDYLVLGLLLLPLALAISLFNGGVLSRWWHYWKTRIPTPMP